MRKRGNESVIGSSVVKRLMVKKYHTQASFLIPLQVTTLLEIQKLNTISDN